MKFVRLIGWLGAATCLALLSGAGLTELDPIIPGPVILKVTPESGRPSFVDKAVLRFISGRSLVQPERDYGGISAMVVRSGRFLQFSDDGALFSFALTRDGAARDARVAALPPGCGDRKTKKDQDIESVTSNGDALWLGLEWFNRVCRIVPDASGTAVQAFPAAMNRWPKTGGAEAMVRLPDGRFVVFAERPDDDSRPSPVLVFPSDPVARALKPVKLTFLPPPGGYRVCDAVLLSDGRLLVLVRRFQLPFEFDTRVLLLDHPDWKAGATLSGREILRLEPPGIHDNFEALAVEETDKGTTLWIASDDNFLPLQKNWLLEFSVSPKAGG